jgi:hypothetical protein
MEDHVNRPTKMGARVLITDGGYDYLTRLDFVVLDELDYLPFAQAGGQLLFHPISRLCERTSIIVTTPGLRRMAFRLRRREDDDRAAGPAHPSLRDHRDRKRVLALQEPLSKLKPKTPITRTWPALCNHSRDSAAAVESVGDGLPSAEVDDAASYSSLTGGISGTRGLAALAEVHDLVSVQPVVVIAQLLAGFQSGALGLEAEAIAIFGRRDFQP